MTEATNSGGPLSYSGYLRLDKVLAAQEPRSSAHDELLFIIQHQTSELWMKLAIHELNATCRQIAADDLQPAFKMLSRVSRIFEQLNSAWDVLRTMTPSEYTQFRATLGQSSGLESHQYRMIEYLVGNKDPAMMRWLDTGKGGNFDQAEISIPPFEFALKKKENLLSDP